MARYVRDKGLEEYVKEIGLRAGLVYLDYTRIKCVRSFETRSRNVAARVHAGSRALWTGLGLRPCYVIEFVSEVFDNLSDKEKVGVILHELLHIPRAMGGGLISHSSLDFKGEVERLSRRLKELKNLNRRPL